MPAKIYRWTPDNVRALRAALGCTQRQFASLIEVATATIISWERGHHEPNALSSRRLGTALEFLHPDQRPAVVAGTYTLAHMHEDRPQTHLILCEESPTYRAIALAEGAYVPPHLLT